MKISYSPIQIILLVFYLFFGKLLLSQNVKIVVDFKDMSKTMYNDKPYLGSLEKWGDDNSITFSNLPVDCKKVEFLYEEPFKLIIKDGKINIDNEGIAQNKTIKFNKKVEIRFIKESNDASLGSTFLFKEVKADVSSKDPSPVMDAIAIDAEDSLTTGSRKILATLRLYKIDSNKLKINPFLNTYINLPKNFLTSENSPPNPTAQSLPGKALNTNVTNFADGLAQFMIKRTKQELSIAFFQKFKEDLADTNYQELKILFPQTHQNLLNIDSEIYNYNAYLTTLRQGFDTDLSNVFMRFPDLLESNKYKEILKKSPELQPIVQTFALTYYSINELANGVHPGTMIERIPADQIFKDEKNIKPYIQTLQLLSSSLKSNKEGDTRYWADAAAFSRLFNPANEFRTFKIYLGLVYELEKKKQIGFTLKPKDKPLEEKSLHTILEEVANNNDSLMVYLNTVRTLVNKIGAVEKSVENIYQKKENNKAEFEDYSQYFTACVELLDKGLAISDLPYIKEKIPAKVETYIDMTRYSAQLYVDAGGKKYTQAVQDAVNLLGLFIPETKDSCRLLIARDFIQRYGTFMANVAQAKDGEEVAQAIENVALPAGSWRVKRADKFSISINGYLGGFAAREYQNTNTYNSLGIAAPVGFAFNWGLNCYGTKHKVWKNHSLSLFVPLIDIGAVTAFRFNNDSSQIPTIQLKNILAPGLYGIWGIGNTPISLGLGAQYGPQLRKVGAAQNDLSENFYVRYGAFLAVDIPMFYLHSTQNIIRKRYADCKICEMEKTEKKLRKSK